MIFCVLISVFSPPISVLLCAQEGWPLQTALPPFSSRFWLTSASQRFWQDIETWKERVVSIYSSLYFLPGLSSGSALLSVTSDHVESFLLWSQLLVLVRFWLRFPPSPHQARGKWYHPASAAPACFNISSPVPFTLTSPQQTVPWLHSLNV